MHAVQDVEPKEPAEQAASAIAIRKQVTTHARCTIATKMPEAMAECAILVLRAFRQLRRRERSRTCAPEITPDVYWLLRPNAVIRPGLN